MKNPNRLLKKIKTSVNKNLRDVLNNQPESIIPPIPKKYLPSGSPLRLLYNEAYYNHYAGLPYSALSICNIITERLTRIFYKSFKPNGNSTKWGTIIPELKAFFREGDLPDKNGLIVLMDDFDYYRDKIRNLLLHGKVEEYLKSTTFKYNAINVTTLKREEIELGYNDSLHGDKKTEIFYERMALDTHNMLILFSIVIQKYSKYIQDNLD